MRSTFLDRAIGWFSPAAATRRIRERVNLDRVTRSYTGAAAGRNTADWFSPSSSADAEIILARQRLSGRASQLLRNNPSAAKAVTVFATDIIGNGITPRPRTGNEARDAKIKEAFKIFVDQADADGQLDFYGLQTLAVRLMVERGEVLARRRWRAPWNK